jgi:hypothetical protein
VLRERIDDAADQGRRIAVRLGTEAPLSARADEAVSTLRTLHTLFETLAEGGPASDTEGWHEAASAIDEAQRGAREAERGFLDDAARVIGPRLRS